MSVPKPFPTSLFTSPIGSEGLDLPPREVSCDYIALDPRFLYPDQVADFPIYIYHAGRQRFVLFKGEGESIQADQLERLSRGGRHPVYVANSYAAQFTHFLSKNLNQIIDDPTLSVDEKTQRFATLANSVMQSLFDAPPDMQEFIAIAKNVSDNLANLISTTPSSIAQLNGLRSYDYYTYSHSLNVCVLGIGLYRQIMSNASHEDIQNLTRGLLLHDVGKCDIPLDLTNKNGPLSEAEWAVMRSHPLKGFERLESDTGLSVDAHQVALYHHEAGDGSGYPHGLTLNSIPLISRICKVVDVYDALTSNRSYKKRMTPFDSLSLMMNTMKNHFDKEILKEFILFLRNMGKISLS